MSLCEALASHKHAIACTLDAMRSVVKWQARTQWPIYPKYGISSRHAELLKKTNKGNLLSPCCSSQPQHTLMHTPCRLSYSNLQPYLIVQRPCLTHDTQQPPPTLAQPWLLSRIVTYKISIIMESQL